MALTRRGFVAGAAAGLLWSLPERAGCAPFPVQFRKTFPYESLFQFIEPGYDEFVIEQRAAAIKEHLTRLPETGALPLARGFEGASPMPSRLKRVADGVFEAEFDSADRDFEKGVRSWVRSLGKIRSARFFVLANDRVRYEIASAAAGKVQYRTGLWKQTWVDGRLSRFEPVMETLVEAPRPLFQDVTERLFGGVESFEKQMLRGVPYWRARLDSACGIDVYGNSGIAVGDIDGDGWDEIYVCQPAGLPNRLYKNRNGRMEDITARWGVAILDDTTSALFVDFRNTGRQDLVVLNATGPLLFLNEGTTFRYKPGAFHFANAPQGTFTGMAAADYDRDARVDLYLCTYVYFQSEDQYRYPVPYHDAQNGPPNFLFHNDLTEDGGGFFNDVTGATGLNENNNRYSFAAAWCDYDGDGWPDLYVANDFGRKNLYQNKNGKFRDVAAAAGVEDIGPGMSASWLDYDGDGSMDLYVSNMWTEAGQRVVSAKEFLPGADAGLRQAYRRHTKGNSLYRNRGDGTFEETGASEGVVMGRWAWASDAADFDNDGTPEIYVGCGMLTNPSEKDLMSFFWRQVVARSPVTKSAAPAYENGWNAINQLIRQDYSWNGREPNVCYTRRGGRFFDFSGISGLDYAEDTRAFSFTDLDGDGNIDLLLRNRLGPQVRALRNEWGVNRRSIAIELQGVRSNRDAIGAFVEVRHAGARSLQLVQAGSGFLSQHTKRLHFGLGDSEIAEQVRVRWPSGLVQDFLNLTSGFRYRIVEGSAKLTREPFAARKPAADSGDVRADNRMDFEPVWLLEPVPLPDVRKGPGFLCLTAGDAVAAPPGVPFEVVDLKKESGELAACYAIFRRYLLDYRTSLTLPLLLLIDERGRAHKIYPSVPEPARLREDLRLMSDPDRAKLALPFAGKYYAAPHRNHFRLGAAFFWAGYPEQSLIYLGEAVRLEPGNGKAHLAIGHIHLERGGHGLARKHLELAASLLPDSPDAWINLGNLEMALTNYQTALRNFEKAIAIRPDGVFALASAGQAHARMGNAAAAEKMFRRALEIDKQSADAADQLGLLLAQQNRLEEARAYFEQAITAQRDHAAAINNLGVLYIEMHKMNDAIAAFRYGLEVAPDDDVLYLNLARVYVQSGDRGKARDILQQLLARKPGSAVARKALEELGER